MESTTALESDFDDVDAVSKLQRLIRADKSDDTSSIKLTSSKLVSADDGGSLRRNNKVHPGSVLMMTVASKPKLQRPLSTDFQHTINLGHLTHRRTQSYAASTTHNRLQENGHNALRRPSRGISSLRSADSVTNMREYYAAPSFIEASLVERHESFRRKTELKTVVELVFYFFIFLSIL